MKKNFIWHLLTIMMVAMTCMTLASCTDSNDAETEEGKQEENLSNAILGSWVVVMDDPSWKAVVNFKTNGVCEGTDWYDIMGDKMFSEEDSRWKGTYSLNGNKITISANSVIEGSYTFSSVSSDYFEAADEDGWKIYATRK